MNSSTTGTGTRDDDDGGDDGTSGGGDGGSGIGGGSGNDGGDSGKFGSAGGGSNGSSQAGGVRPRPADGVARRIEELRREKEAFREAVERVSSTI